MDVIVPVSPGSSSDGAPTEGTMDISATIGIKIVVTKTVHINLVRRPLHFVT